LGFGGKFIKMIDENDLVIIIPLLNCLEYTRQMLLTIQTSYKFKLILINNGSTDGTGAYINKCGESSNVYPINFNENKGVSASWNLGIKMAIDKCDSKYFFIPNNDVLLHPKTIDTLIEKIDQKGVLMATATDISGSIPTPSDIKAVLAPPESLEVEAPDFSCFLIKRETIRSIGYFDESFYPAYFEDNDYHYRIKLSGGHAYRYNQAIYFHYGSRTIKAGQQIKDKANLGYTINRDYFIRKWGGEPGKEIFKTPFNK
jgi:O-antigen biosynthesis protein